MIHDTLETLQNQIRELESQVQIAREDGYNAAILERLQKLDVKEGDVLVLKTNAVESATMRNFMEKIRTSLKLKGIIMISHDDEIRNLSEINMGLLGWVKK